MAPVHSFQDGAGAEFVRLSEDSPVGRAVSGQRKGDLVEAIAPHRIRHPRIAEVDRRRR